MAIGSTAKHRDSAREGAKREGPDSIVCVGKLMALAISVLISPIKR